MTLLIMTFVFSMAVMISGWLAYCYTDNPGVIDVFWGGNIAAIGLLYGIFGRHFDSILSLALVLWALRLSLFLYFTRIHQGERDPRYQRLNQGWQSQAHGYLSNFLIQGVVAWFIALPFYFIAQQGHIASLHKGLGLLIVIAGLLGESFADYSLYKFKCRGKKGVLRTGLWQFSRHPNYFFECLIWLGFSMLGIHSLASLWSLASVTSLFCVMWFITIPITEQQSLSSRGEAYRRYQVEVSCFIPRSARRGGA